MWASVAHLLLTTPSHQTELRLLTGVRQSSFRYVLATLRIGTLLIELIPRFCSCEFYGCWRFSHLQTRIGAQAIYSRPIYYTSVPPRALEALKANYPHSRIPSNYLFLNIQPRNARRRTFDKEFCPLALHGSQTSKLQGPAMPFSLRWFP